MKLCYGRGGYFTNDLLTPQTKHKKEYSTGNRVKMERLQSSEVNLHHDHRELRETNQEHLTMKNVGTVTDIKGLSHAHYAEFSRKHPFFPKHYVMPWKQDMVNRKLILKHAEAAGVYRGACEDSLFVENKERLCHGEERNAIMEKLKIPSQPEMRTFPLHSPLSRYQSYIINQKSRTLGPSS